MIQSAVQLCSKSQLLFPWQQSCQPDEVRIVTKESVFFSLITSLLPRSVVLQQSPFVHWRSVFCHCQFICISLCFNHSLVLSFCHCAALTAPLFPVNRKCTEISSRWQIKILNLFLLRESAKKSRYHIHLLMLWYPHEMQPSCSRSCQQTSNDVARQGGQEKHGVSYNGNMMEMWYWMLKITCLLLWNV